MFSTSFGGNKSAGKRYRIGGKEVQEEKLLSEGGYAYVYKVTDCYSGETYAMKKMICQNEERLKTARNEINVLKSLPPHPNILGYHGSEIIKTDDGWIAYLLIEFCEGGSVFDLMQKYEQTKLQEKQILFVLREVCEAVKVMHSMNPPIAHRDIKIENVLLNNKSFKLCDFGSCSTDQIDLEKIEKSKYFKIEEVFERNTTLMYRPPEMCDLYQQYPITPKADVWMIGCMLYTMCYYKHPFAEMSKLAIVNATFVLPDEPRYPEKLKDLIRLMLTPDPRLRPDIFEVLKLINNFDSITSIKLNQQALEIKGREARRQAEMQSYEAAQSKIKKFNGDIPLDELQKLREKIARKKQAEEGGLKDWGDFSGDPDVKLASDKYDDDEFGGFSNKPSISKKNVDGNDWGQWEGQKTQKSADPFAEFGGFGGKTQTSKIQGDPFAGFGSFGDDGSKKQAPLHKNYSQPPQKSQGWDGFDFGGSKPQTESAGGSLWESFGATETKSKPKEDNFQDFFNQTEPTNLHRAASDKTHTVSTGGWGDWGSTTNTSTQNNSNNQQQSAQPKQQQQTVDLLELADANAPKEKIDLNLIDF